MIFSKISNPLKNTLFKVIVKDLQFKYVESDISC
jgi:hypothetical protein